MKAKKRVELSNRAHCALTCVKPAVEGLTRSKAVNTHEYIYWVQTLWVTVHGRRNDFRQSVKHKPTFLSAQECITDAWKIVTNIIYIWWKHNKQRNVVISYRYASYFNICVYILYWYFVHQYSNWGKNEITLELL